MATAQNITIELFGVKKRINSIKNIIQYVEQQNKLKHISLVSTQKCVIFLYNWGHLIIYSYPKDSLVTIDILSSLNLFKTTRVKDALLKVLGTNQHKMLDTTRIIGDK